MGKGQNSPHKKLEREERQAHSTVSMDYAFMTSEKETREEKEG